MVYDLIIIGAGPAGITAAVYAARKRLKVLVISRDIGGQAAWSGDIENYTGYHFISGPELVIKFEDHMRRYKIEVKEGETVTEIGKNGDLIFIKTDKDSYETKSAIIAAGKKSRELGISGEAQYKNRGLTYCATCDGPLFAGKDVAVIGGGNSALDATLQLIKIAKHVYMINIAASLTGDEVMREKAVSSDRVTIFNSTRITEIVGEKFVTGIKISRDSKEELLAVQGVFVEIGLIPNTEFKSQVEKNELGEIIVNLRNETNLPGIFAAGDVTNVPEKQIIIAAGEGSKAALGVFRYLSRHKSL